MSAPLVRPLASNFAGPSRLSSGASPSPDPSSSTNPSPISRLNSQTFHSSLPLAVSVSLSDLPSGSDTSLAAEYIYYTTVRRNLYLPLILQEVKEALVGLVCDFQSAATIKDEDLWFEYKGIPLRWHWPIGLLYDQAVNNLSPTIHSDGTSPTQGSSRKRRDASPSRNSPYSAPPPPLPWHIILHLKDFPHARLSNPISNPTLPACETAITALIESSKQAYMAMLKEADFIRNGNTKKVNNLRRPEQDGIWDALRTGDYNQFASLMTKILPAASAYPTPIQTSAPPSSFPPTSFRSPSHNLSSDGSTDVGLSAVPRRASSLYAAPPSGLPGSSHLNTSNPNLPIDRGSEESRTATPDIGSTNQAAVAESGSRTVKGQGLPGLKAIPVKFLLQGGTVLQEGVPPLTEDGKSMTLHHVLSALFPALFPLQQQSSPSPTSGLPAESDSRLSTFGIDFSPLSFNPSFTSSRPSNSSSNSNSNSGPVASSYPERSSDSVLKGHGAGAGAGAVPSGGGVGGVGWVSLAVPILQGIRIPLDSSISQIARILSGADGWLTIVLLLLPEGDRA